MCETYREAFIPICDNVKIWATVKIRQNSQPKTHKGVY